MVGLHRYIYGWRKVRRFQARTTTDRHAYQRQSRSTLRKITRDDDRIYLGLLCSDDGSRVPIALPTDVDFRFFHVCIDGQVRVERKPTASMIYMWLVEINEAMTTPAAAAAVLHALCSTTASAKGVRTINMHLRRGPRLKIHTYEVPGILFVFNLLVCFLVSVREAEQQIKQPADTHTTQPTPRYLIYMPSQPLGLSPRLGLSK